MLVLESAHQERYRVHSMRILILEDRSLVADDLSRMLRRQGCAVEIAPAREDILPAATVQHYDLVILDVSSGALERAKLFHAMKRLRDQVPMLLLTAANQIDERVQALELGADCLAEPFAMPELAARVHALVRRSQARRVRKLVVGPLIFNPDTRRAYLAGEPLALLPREWDLLEVLLREAGHVVSKDTLIESLAGRGKPVTPNTIETYVSRLRGKLEHKDIRIRTVHRVGYMLEVGTTAAWSRAVERRT